jgi:hypothetical protein
MSLALNIDYNTVLHSIGSDVKSTLPTKASCPLCGGVMSLLPNDGDIWISCNKCKFHGDSVLLYKTVKQIPDINSAIQEIIQFGGVIGKADFEECSNYISQVVKPLGTIDDFYKEATSTLNTGVGGSYGKLLQQYNVYRPWNPEDRMTSTSKWLGALPKGTSIFKSDLFTTNSLSTSNRYSNALLMPFYTLPGRISGFQVFAPKTLDFKLFAGYEDEEIDGGLAMLDTVTVGEDLVYAVDSPLLALQMQIIYNENHPREIPMVVFNDETDKTWSVLSAKKVVFFSPEGVTTKLLKHAIKFANGYVSTYSNADLRSKASGTHINRFLKGTPPEELLGLVDTYTVHWAKALKDLLLHNLHSIPETILELELQLSHKEALKQECSYSEWEVLNRYLMENITTKEIQIDGKTILERPDGYWLRQKDGQAERISNLYLNLDKVVRLRRSNKTIYSGEIKISNYTIPFSEESTTFGSSISVARWIENATLDSGCPVLPVLHRSWKGRLFEIAKLFNPPTVELGAERVEWDTSTDSAIFPWFRIHDGDFISNRVNTLGENTPFAKARLPLMPVNKSDLSQILRTKYASTAIPLILHMCRNFLAEKFDWGQQSLFMENGQLLGGFLDKQLLIEDKDDLSSFPSVIHNVQLEHIEKPRENIIGTSTELGARCIALRPDTTVLLQDVKTSESVMDVLERFIIYFLRWVSRNSIEYDREVTPTQFVLNLMQEYILGIDEEASLTDEHLKNYQSHELDNKLYGKSLYNLVTLLGGVVDMGDFVVETPNETRINIEWLKTTILQMTGFTINEFTLVQSLRKEGSSSALKGKEIILNVK